ncbi:tRNA lysidine(34) synthetase TilS [Sphingomonas sp. DG1-23]|uniref:tRNA lysidine(34) synthetase TilS n=1 Tax=Sphingomonas sp. DG1-23 TaxID=3068316 RepID=UPI00273FE1E1|nr:tRNA lysidine(34) synthetase TilS [Sphingomonas sp. DG1-23]MDP5279440.1 tRNA lysidine(34) synthetase TilS [Sphingomonas sp. DG1-23]
MLGLAVSGGPDSLALLLLAAAAFPGRVIAATVDHGLRPEAAEEARFVGEICAARGVPHTVLTGALPAGNLQESARELRYALLAEWARDRAPHVATGHQQDDLAETLLMRARRGAGVSGLAAMHSARPLGGVTLIRPLLGWSRAALEAIVAAAGLTPVHDPSNRDPRFDRARMRHLLAESPELPADRLALAARNLRHAEDALAWATEREWQARGRIDAGCVVLDARGLPYELRRRLVERAVQSVCAGPALRGESLDRLLATLDAGGTGTIAGVKAGAKYAEWRFSAAPARRSH